MTSPIHGLLLAVCLLVLHQVSAECSTPPSPSPADHLDDALRYQLLLPLDAEAARTAWPPTSTEVAAGDGRTAAAAAAAAAAALSTASATTSPAQAMAGAVASSPPRQTGDRALLLPAGMLLRSKLARRFLAGAGAVDEAGSSTDGTAPSCHSFDPHKNCPPASKP